MILQTILTELYVNNVSNMAFAIFLRIHYLWISLEQKQYFNFGKNIYALVDSTDEVIKALNTFINVRQKFCKGCKLQTRFCERAKDILRRRRNEVSFLIEKENYRKCISHQVHYSPLLYKCFVAWQCFQIRPDITSQVFQ